MQRRLTNSSTLMRKLLSLVILIVAAVSIAASDWQTDILGAPYESRRIDQPDDYSGRVVSTVIRRRADCDTHKGVLYVHGYNDYFFQREMGDRFADSCINFYAVDLRKYGRSILPGQKKFQARNLDEYFADIDSALAIMRADSVKDIVLMGHSTGGLITSYYLNKHPQSDIRGLVLNSPFLDWNFSPFMRKVAIPTVAVLGGVFKGMEISQGNDTSAYAESLLKNYHGEWTYNTDWKTILPDKVEASWIRAISRGQKDLDKHGDIHVPILLMHSDSSLNVMRWTPGCQTHDIVLNVDHIAKRGRRLGHDVTEVTVDSGMHDLILSAPAIREKAYQTVFNWLRDRDIFEGK